MAITQDRLQQAALQLFAERGVTQLSVSDLAQYAGVARGTVYNNFSSMESLFEDIATNLTIEMSGRIIQTLAQTEDPALRLANGVRFYVRRAHEEPYWGRFIIRFGATTPTLRNLLEGQPTIELRQGVQSGRFKLEADQLVSAVALMSGGVLTAISLVLDGHRTWRDAGNDMAELCLRAFGVAPKEAQRLANLELPPLPKLVKPKVSDSATRK